MKSTVVNLINDALNVSRQGSAVLKAKGRKTSGLIERIKSKSYNRAFWVMILIQMHKVSRSD
jgi:hypothetical protein